jgi:hypothetical protein
VPAVLQALEYRHNTFYWSIPPFIVCLFGSFIAQASPKPPLHPPLQIVSRTDKTLAIGAIIIEPNVGSTDPKKT